MIILIVLYKNVNPIITWRKWIIKRNIKHIPLNNYHDIRYFPKFLLDDKQFLKIYYKHIH